MENFGSNQKRSYTFAFSFIYSMPLHSLEVWIIKFLDIF